MNTNANWGLVGHDWAVSSLSRDLAVGHIRHAYLFLGPAGIGRRTLAQAFAQALLCGDAPPCPDNRCCTLVAHNTHPDLTLLTPEVSGRFIKSAKISVDAVRELIYNVSLKPVESQRRVAIVLNFEAAQAAAANALLKTLEEPPDDTVLILTAEREEQLLPTITSRCERLLLRPLPVRLVKQALVTRWQRPDDEATLLAHLSGGRLGWAVNMAQDPDALARRQNYLTELNDLLSQTRVAQFAYAEKLAEDREKLAEALELWQSWWRDVLLQASGSTSPLVNIDCLDQTAAAARRYTVEDVTAMLQAVRQARQQLDQNANARLTLEVLLLSLPNTTRVNVR